MADQLLHGEEKFVLAHSGYQGAKKRQELPKDTHWHIADQPSEVKRWRQHPRINQVALARAHTKSSVRAKVEHPFRTIKRQFSYDKVRYRGLAKKHNRLMTLLVIDVFELNPSRPDGRDDRIEPSRFAQRGELKAKTKPLRPLHGNYHNFRLFEITPSTKITNKDNTMAWKNLNQRSLADSMMMDHEAIT